MSSISSATTETKAELASSDDRVDLANLTTSKRLGESMNCLLRETASNSLRDMATSGGWKQGRSTSEHPRPSSPLCGMPTSPLPVHVLEWTDPATSWLLRPLALSSPRMHTARLLKQVSSAYLPASLHRHDRPAWISRSASWR